MVHNEVTIRELPWTDLDLYLCQERDKTQYVSNLIATTQNITLHVIQGWHIETMMGHPLSC